MAASRAGVQMQGFHPMVCGLPCAREWPKGHCSGLCFKMILLSLLILSHKMAQERVPGPHDLPFFMYCDAGWAHPALTGMSQPDWAQLTDALVIPYQADREPGLHIARGSPASPQPAGGYPAALSLPEMILATILRARFRMPLRVESRTRYFKAVLD